jgi:hypothetical protein
MKIREIHVYAHDLPVKNPPRVMSSGTVWSLDTTLVRIVAEDGTEGWARPAPSARPMPRPTPPAPAPR